MRRLLTPLYAATLLLTSTTVHAAPISWSYETYGEVEFNTNNPFRTSSVFFKGSSSNESGNVNLTIYTLTAHSTADPTTPDSFMNVPVFPTMTLTDSLSAGSKALGGVSSEVLRFSGNFFASNFSKAGVVPGGVIWTYSTERVVMLGSDDTGWRRYTVDITEFVLPTQSLATSDFGVQGQPGGEGGRINASVRVEPAPSPGAPEPTGLLLACLGLPALLWVRRTRQY